MSINPDGQCELCHVPFKRATGRGRPRAFCSSTCQRRANKRRELGFKNHRQRARRFGVHYEPVKREYIYERDKWMCGICKAPIDMQLQYPEHMSASLDHIVPMSLGGAHSPANLQAAHWICNSLKSSGAGEHHDQLMLFG